MLMESKDATACAYFRARQAVLLFFSSFSIKFAVVRLVKGMIDDRVPG